MSNDPPRTCGDCVHWRLGDRPNRPGWCLVPLPVWLDPVNAVEGEGYPSHPQQPVPDATLCECFERAPDADVLEGCAAIADVVEGVFDGHVECEECDGTGRFEIAPCESMRCRVCDGLGMVPEEVTG